MKKATAQCLTIKSKKGQSLNRREAELIGSGAIPGFLRIELREGRQSWRLDYDIGGLITLREFLNMTVLSRRMFAGLLKNLVNVLEETGRQRLSQQLIVFNLDSVWLSPSSWQIYLQYIPLQPASRVGTFRELLLQIVRTASFDHNEDTAYAQRFAQTVSVDLTCSAFSVREYLRMLEQEAAVKEDRLKVRCPFCGSRLEEEEQRCPACGRTVSGRFQQEKSEKTSLFVIADSAAKAPFIEKSAPTVMEEETGLSVNLGANGIVTVFRPAGVKTADPWLENAKTGARISVSKRQFRLGRFRRQVDYCIPCRFVSRVHAQILQREQDFLLIDCRSTNGTYLDGCRLTPEEPQPLREGSHIRLGPEEFVFHLQ